MNSGSLLRSLNESLPLDGAPEPPVDRELTALLAPRISVDGGQQTPYPGLTYYRISRPTTFHKSLTHGPMLTVVAQGRKLRRRRRPDAGIQRRPLSADHR